MTTYYVRSTTGNNVNSGASWALAKASIAGISPIAAGDIIYVSQAHAESTAGNVSITTNGTPASPVRIVCVNDGATPPTALATTGTVTCNLSGGLLTVSGTCYVYGIIFICGTGAGNPAMTLGGSSLWQRFKNCKFQLAGTGSAGTIRPNSAGSGSVAIWENCEVKFSAAGQGLTITNSYWNWVGGGITSGGTSPTNLVSLLGTGANVNGARAIIENVDFSNGASGMNLIGAQVPYAYVIVFMNCKVPASWSGVLASAFSSNAMGRIEMYNCDNAASNYKIKVQDGCGSVDSETTIVKTGGASDGTTALSWKMVSNAAVGYPCATLYSPEAQGWIDQTGVAKTLTFDVLRDSASDLTDADIWVEVNYPSASGSPLNTFITDQTADVLTAAASQDASSASWTTTGMSNPNKQKLVVTFTPQMKGLVSARVGLGKASATVYVDPKFVIT